MSLVKKSMDSHPNLGFGWVQVSARGFKFQSEVEVYIILLALKIT